VTRNSEAYVGQVDWNHSYDFHMKQLLSGDAGPKARIKKEKCGLIPTPFDK
jgi:hypothetical protein